MSATTYLKYLMEEDEEEVECPSVLHKRLASFAVLAAAVVSAQEYTPRAGYSSNPHEGDNC
jgi:hypothetical protein